MMKKPYKLFIFDFDGTLADTKECVVAAFQESLLLHSLPKASRKDIIHLMGRSLKEVFIELVPSVSDVGLYDQLVESYRKLYTEFIPKKTFLFKDIELVLKSLKKQKVLLSIATSKKTSSVKDNLFHLGIQKYFDLIIGDDMVSKKKPHPEMVYQTLKHFKTITLSKTLVIGDSTYDIEMGNAAGVKTCAVTWGAHSKKELLQSKPTHLIDNALELLHVS